MCTCRCMSRWDKAWTAIILLWHLPDSPHIPAVAMTTNLPSGNKCLVPLTRGNRMHTCHNHTHCMLLESRKHTHTHGVSGPHSQTHKKTHAYLIHVSTCTHTHPFPRTMVGLCFFFLAKNYMSFNVITGLTRTDSLCLLLCAGPPWERQTGTCTEYLSNL